MGSLAPQGGGSGGGGGGGTGNFDYVVIGAEDEAFVTSTTYANALVVDLQTTVDHVIQIKNTDASIPMFYKIYASPKVTGSAPSDGDDSWFNILSTSTNPQQYNHDKEKRLPALKWTAEGLSSRYAWLRIQIKSDSGTPTAKIWVRGTVP